MSESIHGHEVMRMMVEENQAYTPETLENAIVKRFGADARFHTCSAENMTARDLIGFLAERGKFVGSDKNLSMRSENICNH